MTVAFWMQLRMKQRDVQLCILAFLGDMEIRTFPHYSWSLLLALGHWYFTLAFDLDYMLVLLLGRLVECWREWCINREIQKP